MADSPTVEVTNALARLAAGDPAAREQLLVRTQQRLQRLASKMLHGGFSRLERFEQTDDVMQSMFLRLLKGWDGILVGERGQALTDAGVFLCRATRLLREVLLDMARQHYGRAGNRPGRVSLDAADQSSDGTPGYDPGTETLNPEALALFTEFHTAVEALPDHLRQVVDLHWYQEFTHQEVADLLGIAEPTSRKYWVAARLQLTEKLGANPFDRYGG